MLSETKDATIDIRFAINIQYYISILMANITVLIVYVHPLIAIQFLLLSKYGCCIHSNFACITNLDNTILKNRKSLIELTM